MINVGTCILNLLKLHVHRHWNPVHVCSHDWESFLDFVVFSKCWIENTMFRGITCLVLAIDSQRVLLSGWGFSLIHLPSIGAGWTVSGFPLCVSDRCAVSTPAGLCQDEAHRRRGRRWRRGLWARVSKRTESPSVALTRERGQGTCMESVLKNTSPSSWFLD